ncbi:MAG: 3',5'-cyclic-AMP phosphodiesterase [Gammaproteobacteria bacterium]|nr:3',5'-cyclic-AMP phosphodiesterase [Gammaproteobacteria bacterium]
MYDPDEAQAQVIAVAVAEAAVVHLVQITDCHILATADDLLHDMNTRQSFEAVSRAAIENSAGLDLLLATGDLSEDASASSYRYLAARFEEIELPVFWIPGNHDDAAIMRDHLRADCIFSARQVLVGNWQIVLLDSTIKGEVGGRVSPQQIEFLDNALRAHPERHALVCLHHQALAAGSEWIDGKGLQQSQQLVDALKSHANVKAVLWGHVHQQAHHCIDGIEWMSTPSSCVQFRPGSTSFAIDDLAPGYRHLCLYADGSIETAVHRVDGTGGDGP